MTETLARLAAMRAQEEDGVACHNYFAAAGGCQVDEAARASMLAWCTAVQTGLGLAPETTWLAGSLLDRYLSSGRGHSASALQDKYQFQLVAVTAFYMAAKIADRRVRLDLESLVALCRGYYPQEDIEATEEDILFALDWRVALPTPMDFVGHYAALLSSADRLTKRGLARAARKYVAHAASDFLLSFYPPSAIGAGCLASALLDTELLDKDQRQALWLQLAKEADLMEIMEVQARLLKTKEASERKAAEDAQEKSKQLKEGKKKSTGKAPASSSAAAPRVRRVSESPAREPQEPTTKPKPIARETTDDTVASTVELEDIERELRERRAHRESRDVEELAGEFAAASIAPREKAGKDPSPLKVSITGVDEIDEYCEQEAC